MAEIELPYPSHASLARFGRGKILRTKLRAMHRNLIDRKKKDWGRSVDLKPTDPTRDLRETDIALIALCRDNIDLVDAFLQHYRALGVDRFIMVDDQSSDGTREHLRAQDDVDVHVSKVRYSEAARGRVWREMLLRQYGKNRWYLNVDIDEFLVFPERYGTDLRALIKSLEQRGERHMWAPMLDMVPDFETEAQPGSLQQGDRFSTLDEMLSICPYFDRDGYLFISKSRQQHLLNGSRQRIFGQTFELTKYPLLYVDRHTTLGLTIHAPMPYWRNLVPARGVLLHFKYLPGFLARTHKAVEDGQYYDGASYYRDALQTLEQGDVDWYDPEVSVRYENPDQLAKLGFVK